jgi:hypothetical protein
VIGALALPGLLWLLLPAHLRIERAALWGLMLLVGMAGWGGLVGRLAFAGAHSGAAPDLGLRLAWGASALVGAGGFLCLVSLARAPVLLSLVLGGVALAVVPLARARVAAGEAVVRWLRLWPPAVLVAFAALAALAVVWYLAGAAGMYLNGNDDQAAYIDFAHKILDTGSLVDPFSMRRITAYGGHSLLQALTLLGAGSPLQVPLLDVGLATLVVLVLLVGAFDERTPRGQRPLAVLPALLLLTMPNIRFNSASEMSGVVFFLALYRTAASRALAERPAGRAVVLGLVGAAACTLRHSYLVPVAVFFVALYLPSVIAAARAERAARPALLRGTARAAGALVLFLLPWALLAYRSSRTFLFPLMSGNYNAAYGGFTTHSDALTRLKFLWINACHCHPIAALPFFVLCAMLIPARRTHGALRALLVAAFVGFVSVVFSLPLSDRWNIARYYYAFSTALVLATLLAALSARWSGRAGRLRTGVLAPAVLAIVAAVAQVQETHGDLHGTYEQLFNRIDVATARHGLLDDHGDAYRRMQATIPAGPRVLALLDDAYWLDFRRNRVDLLDLPGAASPAPGMPLDDDEKLASYLQAQGYRYVAFVRPTVSRELYRRDLWQKQLAHPTEEIWRLSAPFYLNTFDRLEGLARSRAHLFDDGQMVALDLEARAPR